MLMPKHNVAKYQKIYKKQICNNNIVYSSSSQKHIKTKIVHKIYLARLFCKDGYQAKHWRSSSPVALKTIFEQKYIG